MNLHLLKTELTDDPSGLGLIMADISTQCTLLNAYTFSMARHLMISERGILSHYADGALAADAVLSKLEAFSLTAHAYASLIRRVLKFLSAPEGIDLGDPATQTMITNLGAAGVITPSEAIKLNNIAIRPASRAEILGFGQVTDVDINLAMAI